MRWPYSNHTKRGTQ